MLMEDLHAVLIGVIGGLGMRGPGFSPPAASFVHGTKPGNHWDDHLAGGRRNAVWGLWQDDGANITKTKCVR